MSGGHFDYKQTHLGDIADAIEKLIKDNDRTDKTDWGDDIGRHYTPETIAKFRLAVEYLNECYEMVHRIDWLVSGDDGEESFHRQWDEDIKEK